MMCYFFPPIHSVGANRSVGFAQHLPDLGWTPTVLSVTKTRIPWERSTAPVPDGLDIVRAPELNLHGVWALYDAALNKVFRSVGSRRPPAFLRLTSWVPDPQVAWLGHRAALRLARQSECVYVSCSPFSAAVTGAIVARRCRKPLVLDFRDPWQGDGPQLRFERWAIERADALILNTPCAKTAYARRFPHVAPRMVVIPNGFDGTPEPSQPVRRTGTFTIMHVGEFYGSRQPDTLLEVLAELNIPDLEFVQVGPTPDWLDRFSSRVRIRHLGIVPRAQAIEHMRAASLLYLRLHTDQHYVPLAVPAKTYEYLVAGVPILAETQDGDAKTLIREFATQPEIVMPDDRAQIRAAVLRAYGRRHDPGGGVHPLFVERYNRRALTARLAAVLDAVVAGREPGTVTWP
jgi:glycosyltransferase involved in cell wall biosynthesis